MQYLLFQLGGEEYVLEAGRVIEVLPLVEVREVPQAPPGVAGVFNYRGAPVPLIDLSDLALSTPSRSWLSTRIVLFSDAGQLLGLIIERATETLRCEPSDFVASPVGTDMTPYLGGVITVGNRLIQAIELDKLLSADLRAVLFGNSEEVAHVTSRD